MGNPHTVKQTSGSYVFGIEQVHETKSGGLLDQNNLQIGNY